jgi:urease accessory protein
MTSPFATRLFKISAVLALLPAVASAHPGHDGGHDLSWDFGGGFAHPIFGFDHLLAMIAVGIWAAQAGGRARWLVPATFVSVMALAATFGQREIPHVAMEQMVAASLLVFGLMIAMAQRMPLILGLGLTALFATFHGFAHVSALPSDSSSFSFGFGFITATTLLHGAGLVLGSLKSDQINGWLKATGVGISTIGAVMLVVA